MLRKPKIFCAAFAQHLRIKWKEITPFFSTFVVDRLEMLRNLQTLEIEVCAPIFIYLLRKPSIYIGGSAQHSENERKGDQGKRRKRGKRG